MLPVVQHEVRPGRWPYVTVCLIGLNLLVFVFELSLGSRLVPFLQEWGVVPGRIRVGAGGHDVLTVGAAMFLHMGVLQVLGTVWFLWVFGDAVEDADIFAGKTGGPHLVIGGNGDAETGAVNAAAAIPDRHR